MPRGVDVNATTNKAYAILDCLSEGCDSSQPTIVEIDGSRLVASGILALPPGRALAIDVGSNTAYVVDDRANVLRTLDIEARRSRSTFAVGAGPVGVAVDAHRKRIFVVSSESEAVTILTSASNKPLGTVRVDGLPDALAVDTKTGYLYVGTDEGDSIIVIDPANRAVVSRLAGVEGVSALAINATARRLYVASGTSNLVVFDLDSGRKLEAIPLPRVVHGSSIAVFDSTDKILLTDPDSSQLLVIDGSRREVVQELRVGSGNSIAVNQATGAAFVANSSTRTVSVVA